MTNLELFKQAYPDAETQAALEQCFDLGVQQERNRSLTEARTGLATAEFNKMIALMANARTGPQNPEVVIRRRSE
jgi:hypothetical protein